jgi:hypothetical protein
MLTPRARHYYRQLINNPIHEQWGCHGNITETTMPPNNLFLAFALFVLADPLM